MFSDKASNFQSIKGEVKWKIVAPDKNMNDLL